MPTTIHNSQIINQQCLDQAFPYSVQPCGNGEDVAPYFPSRWSYSRRGARANLDQNLWCSLWPSGSFMSGDPASAMTLLGDDCAFGGFRLAFEFTSIGLNGTQSTKFIIGSVIDANGAALPNAMLHPFITSTDVLDGPVVKSNEDGTYVAGVYNGGVAHYIVAYRTDSPIDIGIVSANTLTATNIDGT